MQKLLITFIGVLAIGAALPAVAGGDRQSDQLLNREQARRAKLAHTDEEVTPRTPTLKSGGSGKFATDGQGCPDGPNDGGVPRNDEAACLTVNAGHAISVEGPSQGSHVRQIVVR